MSPNTSTMPATVVNLLIAGSVAAVTYAAMSRAFGTAGDRRHQTRRDRQQDGTNRASAALRTTRRDLGGERGVRVRDAIHLQRSVSEVYGYWRRLESLPTFMDHLIEVREDGDRSHWVAAGPAGVRVEWDAELIADEPERLISWRSLPG
ncbi:MAG TPA: SRPBCC family protein, partial [Luteitalea sp.]|nr:SRPBCC family protein [Luteitalea sp.]